MLKLPQMTFSELMKGRRSRRWFDKNTPIPDSILESILETASRSPSFMNSQPWRVLVAGMQTMQRVVESLEAHQNNGTTTMPYAWPASWPAPQQANVDETRRLRAPHREEPVDLFSKWAYDAPVTVFLCLENSLNEWSIMDLGAFAMAFMLAAEEKGVHSVPQAKLVNNTKYLQQILDLPQNIVPVLGISLGYSIPEKVSNTFVSPRMPLQEFVEYRP